MFRVHVRYERTGDKATQRPDDVFPAPSPYGAQVALGQALADPRVVSVTVEREPEPEQIAA